MRIIAGQAGGLTLRPPPSPIRPTMDRVRGAIFSSLSELVVNAHILDLFAGSGALGLEALSRGAISATFVESHRACVACIEENLRRTHFTACVQNQDVFQFLARENSAERFDIIFADPPYTKKSEDRDFAQELLEIDALVTILKPQGIFLLETSKKNAPLTDRLTLLKFKRYGESHIAFYQKA